ncbi:MAG TPA: ABC transporter permease [Thermoanaerobaculia bacterium]|nr:ABC transporter permease [Thermoanaerobaculia bacterium]
MLKRIASTVRSVFQGKKMESDLDEELRFHVDRETEENLRRGMPAEQARLAALQKFGGIEKTKEEVREADRAVFLETLLQDVRYGLRSLRKSPGYAAAAILTLALGIGANTAIFSVVHGVLLQSLPYGGGDRLVRIRVDAPGAGIQDGRFSVPEMNDLRALSRTVEGIVEYHSMFFVLLGGTEPERVQTGVVSANFFDVLGVRPILGRTFLPGEDKKGAEAVLVISHDYWMRGLGGDPAVVGRVFTMNDRPHTVIGVLPPIPGYPEDNDVYMPVSACPFRSAPAMDTDRSMGMLTAFGRLKPGATVEGARSDLASVMARMAHDHPENYPASARVSLSPIPLREELTRQARPTFLLLFGTVGLVLLLACANVANLSLARLVRREKEMALRSALGAGRGRLTRQLLTESLLISLAGGLIGLGVAIAGRGLLVHFAQRFTPRAGEIAVDAPVLVFSLIVSLAVGVVLGLIPAISRKENLVTALHDGRDTSGASPARRRARNSLIAVQVAISFVLLAGAGLMLRTLWKLSSVDTGFQGERVLTARMSLNFTRYKTNEDRRIFTDQILQRLAAAPGVASVALAGTFPLNEGGGPANNEYRLEGRPEATKDQLPRADFQRVSPDYFKTIGVPVLQGRALAEGDREDTQMVAVINRHMASHVFANESAVGRRLGLETDPGKITWVPIVGVVGDVRQYSIADPPEDQVYLAIRQLPGMALTCLIRTTVSPRSMERLVRETVHAIGPEQPVDRFRTLEEVRSGSLDTPRLTATLLLLFASLALVITATGIAGVIGFSVGQRRQEFGIRMALGAKPRSVLAMVLGQGMRQVAIGLAIGLAGALALSRLWSSLLYEVSPYDPPTFFVVALMLLAVAALACFLPARRATSVDPMVALRSA